MTWHKDTPWGLSKDAAAFLPAFIRRLREGELRADVLDRPEVGELLERKMIELRADAGENNWVIVETVRGKEARRGLRALAEGQPVPMEGFWATYGISPNDGRTVDERLQSIMDLQARRRELEAEVAEARAVVASFLAHHAKQRASSAA